MKVLGKIVLVYSALIAAPVVASFQQRSLLSAMTMSVGDANLANDAKGETCSAASGCDPDDLSKVLVCDKGTRIQRLFRRAKPKTYCKKLDSKLGRWLKNGRASCGNCKAFSCQSLLKGGGATSGLYQLSPDGANPFSAYCDQTTADGGWMLFFAYKHASADALPLNPDKLPTDPENGYSHMLLQQLGYSYTDIQALRFYCTCSSHNRTVHFANTNTSIIQMAHDGNDHGCDATCWNSSLYSTTLSDHTGDLPYAATDVTPGTLTNSPFFNTDSYWSVAAGLGSAANTYFECDNNQEVVAGYAQDAHHTIWVRMSR